MGTPINSVYRGLVPVALLQDDEGGLDHALAGRPVADVLSGHGDLDLTGLAAEVVEVFVGGALPAFADQGQGLKGLKAEFLND